MEAQLVLQPGDVQVHVADGRPVAGVRARRLAGLPRDGQQAAQVQRLGAAGIGAGARQVRPLLARAVGGELEAVAVRVGQVDRLVRAVVGGALDRRARGQARRSARASSSRVGYRSATW